MGQGSQSPPPRWSPAQGGILLSYHIFYVPLTIPRPHMAFSWPPPSLTSAPITRLSISLMATFLPSVSGSTPTSICYAWAVPVAALSLSKNQGFSLFFTPLPGLTSNSDATKDRFISTYHLPESIIPADNPSTDHLPLTMLSTKSRPHPHSRSTSVLSFGSPGKRDAVERAPSSTISSKPKVSIAAALPGLQQVASRSQSKSSTSAKSTKDYPAFVATVLELVKLIQAGLFISGMYKVSPETAVLPHLDGLLCDETVEGIQKWIIEVGNPCVELEVQLLKSLNLIPLMFPSANGARRGS